MIAVFFRNGKQIDRWALQVEATRVWRQPPRKKGWAELYQRTHKLPTGEWAFCYTPQEGR